MQYFLLFVNSRNFSGYRIGVPAFSSISNPSLLAELRKAAFKVLNLEENLEDLRVIAAIAEKNQPGIRDALFGDPQLINRKVIQMIAEF